jgi:ABC-2 type transport system permease protein
MSQSALAYLQAMAPLQSPDALIAFRAPSGQENQQQASPLSNVIGRIMSGMLIFFAFFTGANTAQSILRESEQGTLARLFTTATKPAAILTGKFLAVLLTVLVQVSVLLAAARLVFGIQWGVLPVVVLAAVGIVACASAFGIFLASITKTTRQAGAVFGGLLTVTGMVGMLPTFAGGDAVTRISLIMPQGWAVRSLSMAMEGADVWQMLVNLAVLIGLSVLLFTVGALKFSKRFAASV